MIQINDRCLIMEAQSPKPKALGLTASLGPSWPTTVPFDALTAGFNSQLFS